MHQRAVAKLARRTDPPRLRRAMEHRLPVEADEADVAAKHQSDVAKITSIRVVDRQEGSPNEVTMSVYIGGVDRLEKVRMNKVGNDWKFGGFIREPKQ